MSLTIDILTIAPTGADHSAGRYTPTSPSGFAFRGGFNIYNYERIEH